MAKVTLRPSEEVVARAAAEHTVTDTNGRQITLKKPGILAQFRLVEAMGPDAAENAVYRTMCMPVIYVAAIDGEPIIPPTSKLELEALISQLDEAGLMAVQLGMAKVEGGDGGGADTAKN
ncbi:hypothetical protein [Cupriavidus taiwanensis]|uniref:hypothetical protein n=1 Tax=Cupriavidus taiwanensis TaxID=164546 RepID=UPI000E109CA0|nr:hypothetical protein [Cupriavidus taiwanensis]SOY56857.1 conserved hypothetical protein [Cupriavidus taiwanensis]SOY90796.1 conserved hypothetical protein [Cupriavidus taiwanensis]SOZ63567.1 conserved hypothetical protein [Cupriavidus taiwanensis]SOZ82606.1 conserved hypothetical protein [Cupriavidus taiwanensis]SOZ84449.1 conserved hypothetical protein [Cupriavidus taiwanensis]